MEGPDETLLMCITTAINLIKVLSLRLLSLPRVCEDIWGACFEGLFSLMVQMDSRSIQNFVSGIIKAFCVRLQIHSVLRSKQTSCRLVGCAEDGLQMQSCSCGSVTRQNQLKRNGLSCVSSIQRVTGQYSRVKDLKILPGWEARVINTGNSEPQKELWLLSLNWWGSNGLLR